MVSATLSKINLVPLGAGKRPVVGARKFCGEEELRTWLSRGDVKGFGLLGRDNGLIFVDLDVPLAREDLTLVREFEPAWTTPSGGLHYIFWYDGEVRPALKLVHGDLIWRGYIVLYGELPHEIVEWPFGVGERGEPKRRKISDLERRFNREFGQEKVVEWLCSAGWHSPKTDSEGRVLLTRPEKSRGISGSVWPSGWLYVFTSNAAGFEMETSYSPWEVYVIAGCSGNKVLAEAKFKMNMVT